MQNGLILFLGSDPSDKFAEERTKKNEKINLPFSSSNILKELLDLKTDTSCSFCLGIIS